MSMPLKNSSKSNTEKLNLNVSAAILPITLSIRQSISKYKESENTSVTFALVIFQFRQYFD